MPINPNSISSDQPQENLYLVQLFMTRTSDDPNDRPIKTMQWAEVTAASVPALAKKIQLEHPGASIGEILPGPWDMFWHMLFPNYDRT